MRVTDETITDLICIYKCKAGRRDARVTPYLIHFASETVAALEELQTLRKGVIPVQGTVS